MSGSARTRSARRHADGGRARTISRPMATATETISTEADTLLISASASSPPSPNIGPIWPVRAAAIAEGVTTNTAADISITSVSFVIIPSRWAAAGNTAASASAMTRARRDSGSHFSSPAQTSPSRSIPQSAAIQPSAPGPRPGATTAAAIR